MGRFWLVVVGLTAVAEVPFALGLTRVLGRLGVPWPLLVASGIALSLFGLLPGRIALVRWDRPLSTARRLLLEEPFYVHWCAVIAGAALFAVAAPLLGLASLVSSEATRLPSLGSLAAATSLAGLLLSFYGVVVRRRWFHIRTIDVSIPGLGAAFEGYRIAQLSDLHIGGLSAAGAAERWVREVNRLDVDLVALTGDYVTSGVAFHEEIARALTPLRARDRVIAVMGNHDYFGDGEPLLGMLHEGGVLVLRNASVRLGRGEDALTVVGVDDTYTRRADVAEALRGCEASAPIIALAHDPALFPELARGGAALVLSGHTHWGQLALPFAPTRVNLSRLSSRYHAGLHHLGTSLLYIHPGLGTTGPPLRIGAAPEITVLRLSRAARPVGERVVTSAPDTSSR